MIKELLEMTNTSQSIAKQNNLKIKKKSSLPSSRNTLTFPRLYFPGAQILPLFPWGSDTHFKSVLVINLHIVDMASTLQTHKGES